MWHVCVHLAMYVDVVNPTGHIPHPKSERGEHFSHPFPHPAEWRM